MNRLLQHHRFKFLEVSERRHVMSKNAFLFDLIFWNEKSSEFVQLRHLRCGSRPCRQRLGAYLMMLSLTWVISMP